MNETKRNTVQKAIDTIEPAAGAKERMLANIQRKAAIETPLEEKKPQTKKPSVLSFKKWTLPVAACLAIAVIGAAALPNLLKPGSDPNIVSQTETGNPFVEVRSADDFERQLGFRIDAPKGAEDVFYHIIDGKIADVDFAIEEHRYNLRASRENDDFSGLYGTKAKTEPLDSDKNVLLTVIQEEDIFYTKITWADNGIHYILSNTDGASENDLKAVWNRVK